MFHLTSSVIAYLIHPPNSIALSILFPFPEYLFILLPSLKVAEKLNEWHFVIKSYFKVVFFVWFF